MLVFVRIIPTIGKRPLLRPMRRPWKERMVEPDATTLRAPSHRRARHRGSITTPTGGRDLMDMGTVPPFLPENADSHVVTKVTYLGPRESPFRIRGRNHPDRPGVLRTHRAVLHQEVVSVRLPPGGSPAGPVVTLVSHAHHDHLDYPSLKRVGRTRPVVVPRGLATPMRWRGFTDVRVLRPGKSSRSEGGR